MPWGTSTETKSAEDLNLFFRREIEPWLEAREQERALLQSRFLRRFLPCVGLVLTGAAVVGAWFGTGLIFVAIVAALLFGSFILFGSPLMSWSFDFNAALMKRLFDFYGYEYSEAAPSGIVERFRAVGILPSYNTYSAADHVTGRAGGVWFEVTEATLVQKTRSKNRDSETTVFHGLLARFDFSKPFEMRTLILADRGVLGRFLGDLLSAQALVRLEDPAFEAVFDVYSPDQIEARYLLTPAFMERLMALKRQVDCPITAAFDDGQFWIAIHGSRDYFPTFSFWSDVRDTHALRALVADITLIGAMVETLKLDSETRV
jgi:hypothetical protein